MKRWHEKNNLILISFKITIYIIFKTKCKNDCECMSKEKRKETCAFVLKQLTMNILYENAWHMTICAESICRNIELIISIFAAFYYYNLSIVECTIDKYYFLC